MWTVRGSRRPFYQSAKSIRLESIDSAVYGDFVGKHFQEAGKEIDPEAIDYVYQTFKGVTLYIQRIMKDAFAATATGETCRVDAIQRIVEDFITENDSRIREQLAFITEPQKELLYAIHDAQEVVSITSAAFTRQYRLKSPSATQSAALRLLEDDFITRHEQVYSIADPLLSLWMDRKEW